MTKDENYLRLARQLYSYSDKTHPDYDGWAEPVVVPMDHSYDTDAITVEMTVKASKLLDELYEKDLLADYLEIRPANDGALQFEWYVNCDLNCEWDFGSKYDDSESAIWMMTGPDAVQTHSFPFSEIVTVKDFSEVEDKVRKFIASAAQFWKPPEKTGDGA